MSDDLPATNDLTARTRIEVAHEVEERLGQGLLTPRRRRMVEAYVEHGTYAAAARASGYAQATVKRLLTEDPTCRAAARALVEQASSVAGVTLERVLHEYTKLAFSNAADFIEVLQEQDPDVALAEFRQLPESVTAAVHRVEVAHEKRPDGSVRGGVKLHLYDKRGALQDLGKVLAMFVDRIEVTDNSTFGQRLDKALAALEEGQGSPDE